MQFETDQWWRWRESLIRSLRYLTCTRLDILYVVSLVIRYMESPTKSYWNAAKRILRYLKGTTNFGLLYSKSNEFKLATHSDSDWAGDKDDRNNITSFIFFFWEIQLSLGVPESNLSWPCQCEAEFVVATACVPHAIWLRRLMKELKMTQQDSIEICVDNKFTMALRIQCSITEVNTLKQGFILFENALNKRK